MKLLKTRYGVLVAAVFFVVGGGAVHSQTPSYSQHFIMPAYYNAAFAGGRSGHRLVVAVRNQYPTFFVPARTYSHVAVLWDKYFSEYKAGLGLRLEQYYDGDGLRKHVGGGISYSYRAELADDRYFRGGIDIGGFLRQYDVDRFVFPDQLPSLLDGQSVDPTEEVLIARQSRHWDIGGGALFYTEKYYIGFGLRHINYPLTGIVRRRVEESSVIGLPMLVAMQGGWSRPWGAPRSREGFVAVDLLYLQQGPIVQTQGWIRVKWRDILAGAGMRYTKTGVDALLCTIAIQRQQWLIAANADMTLSRFGWTNGGAAELMVVYEMEPQRRKRNLECYSFY